ncbi:MAG: hypothetical protein FH749_15700 [Firmicutes bacterium]|nr:hypothetical protein [Bacillota bacterium]
MDISSLVERARSGDEEAFCKLIEARKESVYKIAYCYVKNQQDALDIVGEAVYKAYISMIPLQIWS